jgi:hypothetical protein
MSRVWPCTDVIKDVHIAPDGSCGTARTDLYLQGGRHHVHTTTILIAVDRLMSKLLKPGERLPDIQQLQHRNVSNRNLILTIAAAGGRISGVGAPAVRANLCTSHGRTFFVEGAVCDDRVQRRRRPPSIFQEVMNGMHLEEARGGVHRTTLDALGRSRASCRDPILTRYAIVEFVLEGTRQRILERFGDIEGHALVVSGWNDFVWPSWADVAMGCVLEYRLSEGALSSGVRLVHCDFAFPPHQGSGRVTVARIPAAKMTALQASRPDTDRPNGAHGAGSDPSVVD